MKAPILFTALLALPFGLTAQTDTTRVPEAQMQPLELNLSGADGLNVRMMDGDTVTDKGNFTIDTRFKRITISTVPKPWASSSDSIAEVIKDIRRDRRHTFTHWNGVDLGVNFLVGADGDADLDAKNDFMQVDHARSRFLGINFMEQKVEFGTHHVGLLTGLGFEFVNYKLKNDVSLGYEGDTIYGVPVVDPHFDKNKLRQMGLRVPLMLEFNTKRSRIPTEADLQAARRDTSAGLPKVFKPSHKNNFHMAVGVVGSWYFDTMYKQRYQVDGKQVEDRDKGDFNLLPYRLAASVRIGYGKLNLFAERSLTPLFTDGRTPDLTPITVGLTIVGFN